MSIQEGLTTNQLIPDVKKKADKIEKEHASKLNVVTMEGLGVKLPAEGVTMGFKPVYVEACNPPIKR